MCGYYRYSRRLIQFCGPWPRPQAPPQFFNVILKNWEEPGDEASTFILSYIYFMLCQNNTIACCIHCMLHVLMHACLLFGGALAVNKLNYVIGTILLLRN